MVVTMTTAHNAQITVTQTVQHKQFCPTGITVTLDVAIPEDASQEDRNALITAEINNAKAIVFKQSGLEFTFTPEEENAIQLVADSFPGTQVQVQPQQQPVPQQQPQQGQGWGGYQPGPQQQNYGNNGGGQQRQADPRKPQAAQQVNSAFEQGGPGAVAQLGWQAKNGQYGAYLANQNWNGTGRLNLSVPKDGVGQDIHAALFGGQTF